MKTILSIFAVLMMISTNAEEPVRASKEKADTGIEFHESTWEDALKLARETGMPVFLDISASWCGPCKALKSNTFSDSNVGTFYNANFVNVLVDGEKGEGITLAEKYRITGYPTMIFLDSNGEIIARTTGYREPQEFIELGKQILEQSPGMKSRK